MKKKSLEEPHSKKEPHSHLSDTGKNIINYFPFYNSVPYTKSSAVL